jgi:hypothetical protein
MPYVTIKTGITDPDDHEEKLTEYICDWPGCPNIATDVLGCAKEIGVCAAVCKEHVATKSP